MPLGANKAAIMGVAGVSGVESTIALLTTVTDTDAASIEFKTLINSSYREYVFRFYNLNPTTGAVFQWQVDANGGDDGYNDIYITSTFFRAYHIENDSAAALTYNTGNDEAQTQAYADLIQTITNGADENGNGELHLFNPSSTTYVKHWYSRISANDGTYGMDNFAAGYWNTTSAINAVNFKFASGNFDGTIKMWGVK